MRINTLESQTFTYRADPEEEQQKGLENKTFNIFKIGTQSC